MKFAYFDGSSGLSGDMILAALLDLGISPELFRKKMAETGLPVEIKIKEAKKASLRGLKVEVAVDKAREVPRRWSDIEALLLKMPFSDAVLKNSLAIFRRLFEAEARVHGRKFKETYIHEVGADDAVIDIAGTCFLIEALGIEEIYASPLNLGRGWVKASHGLLPVPPPAVAELLTGVPVYSAYAEEELVTPTGAAIISTLAREFLPFPEISYQKIGYGSGSRDFHDFPNILRVFYGETVRPSLRMRQYLVEANIDDSSPQVLAGFFDKALKLGAQDVFFTPVVMKKNRLGTKLTLLAPVDKIDSLIRAVFEETSSIGVRYYPVERRILGRRMSKVKILGEEVGVKVAYLEGREVNVQPEFSDCLKAAKKTGYPVKKILELALAEFSRQAKRPAKPGLRQGEKSGSQKD